MKNDNIKPMILISSLSKVTELVYFIYIKESLEDTDAAQKLIVKVHFQEAGSWGISNVKGDDHFI